MKTLRILVACAAALLAAHAWAQNATASQQDTSQATQDVGGVPPGTAAGMPMGITRQQVYDDLVRSEKSGELQRLQQDLYRGGN
jgi:hypothetical protein